MARGTIQIAQDTFDYLLDRDERMSSRINQLLKTLELLLSAGELDVSVYERLKSAALGNA
jgi:hypothetical protein